MLLLHVTSIHTMKLELLASTANQFAECSGFTCKGQVHKFLKYEQSGLLCLVVFISFFILQMEYLSVTQASDWSTIVAFAIDLLSLSTSIHFNVINSVKD